MIAWPWRADYVSDPFARRFVCANCGSPATCFGAYGSDPAAYACDACCGHSCSDGHCEQIETKTAQAAE